MNEVITQIERRIADPAPAMLCEPAGGGNGRFVAPVRNAATRGDMSCRIPPVLGQFVKPTSVAWFYDWYHSLHLYGCVNNPPAWSTGCGIEVINPSQWLALTELTRKSWLLSYSEDDGLFYGLEDFVAIGRPCGSWNSFHLVTRGPAAGRVFWWDWDDPPQSIDECIGTDFEDFILNLVTCNPVSLLNDWFGCHSRYFDGITEQQWVPIEYIPDSRR